MKRAILILVMVMLMVMLLPGCAAAPLPAASPAISFAASPSQAGVDGAASPQDSGKEYGAVVVNENYRLITPAEGRELLAGGNVALLDVRTQQEYEASHIPGALLLPYDQIGENTASVIPGRDKPVIVYCRTGRRSAIAAKALTALGYTQVYDLGGIQDWPYDTVSGK